MKLLFTAILISFLFNSYSQTITSSALPKNGSAHSYHTALDADYIEVTKTGSSQIWNLSGMSGGITETIKYEDPSQSEFGNLYPEASFFVKEEISNEVFYKSDDSGLRILGRPTPSIIDPDVIENGALNPPVYIIKTPMVLSQALNQISGFAINIPIEIIPDSILNSLPITPDSLRIKINTSYDYICSGSGTLKLPGKDFNVLQQIAEASTSATPEAKIPFLGWIDISAFIDFDIEEEGSTQIITFWSPDEEGYVAQFQWSEAVGRFTNARYTSNGTILKNSVVDLSEYAMIFPNPVSEIINFTNVPENGVTNISISNALGNTVLKNQKSKKSSLDVSGLPPGIYYIKFETEGQVASVKKFIKI